ncbi:MAG: hypothetical protein GX437_05320 [Sphingobacteriales bacterium]|nr:hypothetical protein [Sphingobacteriales bacterium]
MKKHCFLLAILLIGVHLNGFTQKKSTKTITLSDSMEVLSINTMITAVYDILSGPAGERNWTKLRFFCLPGATFISLKEKKSGEREFFQGSLDDFIKMIDPVLKQHDYYENEIERNVQTADNIANVFSTFESTLFNKDGTTTNQRGVNSFQLIYKEGRWWIANIVWKNEPHDIFPEPGR